MQETRNVGSILGLEDPLKEEMTTHSSILAWRFPWTEEPDGLRSIGLQRVGHDWSNLACIHGLIEFIVAILPSLSINKQYERLKNGASGKWWDVWHSSACLLVLPLWVVPLWPVILPLDMVPKPIWRAFVNPQTWPAESVLLGRGHLSELEPES